MITSHSATRPDFAPRPPLASNNLPLGLNSGSTFEQKTYSVGSGDIFVLYSAGVSEAMNERGEIYTPTRLRRVTVEAGAPLAAAIDSGQGTATVVGNEKHIPITGIINRTNADALVVFITAQERDSSYTVVIS